MTCARCRPTPPPGVGCATALSSTASGTRRKRRPENLKYAALYGLAVMEVYQTEPDRGLEQWITDICDMLVGSGPNYLRDQCGQEQVDLYGYYQPTAVARAGRLLERPDYIKVGVQPAQKLLKPVIDGGFYHVYPGERGPQSVFGLPAIGLGLEELY
jgi:hypothetical protein